MGVAYAAMTPDERRVVLKGLVAGIESLRTLALRHVKGAAANEVARRVQIELARLSAESIAGIQDLWAHADRLVRYRALDLVLGQGLMESEDNRERLRAAVRQLDPQELTIIVALLQGRGFSRALRRWGVGVETAREMERCGLAKLREILSGAEPVSVEQRMGGDRERSGVDTATQALDWVIDLHMAPEMAWLLPQFHAWLSAAPENRREYHIVEAIWRGLTGLYDHGLLGAMELSTRRRPSPAPVMATRGSPTRAHVLLAARALAVVVVLGVSLYAITCRIGQDRIVSGNEGTPALDLVDGSQIGLLAHSQVTLDLTDGHRRISVDRGGAWFHVHKAYAPFEVRASTATVRAVGTRFSVQLTGVGRVNTVVQEGSVVVLVDNRQAVLLAVGQSAEVDAGQVHVTSAAASNVNQPIMRTEGLLPIDGLTLEQVAQAFNRYNRRKINVDEDVAHVRIGGQFRATDPDGFARALEVWGIEHHEARDPRSGAEIIQLSRKKAHSRTP